MPKYRFQNPIRNLPGMDFQFGNVPARTGPADVSDPGPVNAGIGTMSGPKRVHDIVFSAPKTYKHVQAVPKSDTEYLDYLDTSGGGGGGGGGGESTLSAIDTITDYKGWPIWVWFALGGGGLYWWNNRKKGKKS